LKGAASEKAVEGRSRRSRSNPSRSRADAIAQVGTVSANGDQTIGGIIAEAMKKVGKDGRDHVEESKSLDTLLEVVEGMAVRPRLSVAYFVRSRAHEATLENALIRSTRRRSAR